LDRLLGAHDEPTTYRKAELKTFVSLGVEDMLGQDEVALLGSVLEFSGKHVVDVMTPVEDMYSLSAEKIVVRSFHRRGRQG
jgi:metal transporter CNNM